MQKIFYREQSVINMNTTDSAHQIRWQRRQTTSIYCSQAMDTQYLSTLIQQRQMTSVALSIVCTHY